MNTTKTIFCPECGKPYQWDGILPCPDCRGTDGDACPECGSTRTVHDGDMMTCLACSACWE